MKRLSHTLYLTALLLSLLAVNSFAQSFSEREAKIIYGGDTTKMLRVFQTTEPEENKILTTKSSDITHNAKGLQLLIKRMYLTVNDSANMGVGIAAPQLGINKNIIWVQRFDKPEQPFEVFLNISIEWRSSLMRKGMEGCLSIPDITGDVIRNYTIKIKYQTLNGSWKEEIVEGFTAVIFQHEVDHLEGILFPQRITEQLNRTYFPLAEGVDLYLENPSHR